jgi:hypothetical protein
MMSFRLECHRLADRTKLRRCPRPVDRARFREVLSVDFTEAG